MANKKYNEFPAGTYNTSKIFLQADPTTGELEKVNLPDSGGGQKLVALVMQSGTANPSMIILENTTGLTFTIDRWFEGIYRIIPSAAIDQEKTTFLIGAANPSYSANSPGFIQFGYSDTTTILIRTKNAAGADKDGVLYLCTIVIQIYP